MKNFILIGLLLIFSVSFFGEESRRLYIQDIKLKSRKGDGEPWDIGGGAPDVKFFIMFKKSGYGWKKAFETTVFKNSLYISKVFNTKIDAAVGDSIKIVVLDQDSFQNDNIGSHTFTVTEEIFVAMEPQILSFDAVTSLSYFFSPHKDIKSHLQAMEQKKAQWLERQEQFLAEFHKNAALLERLQKERTAWQSEKQQWLERQQQWQKQRQQYQQQLDEKEEQLQQWQDKQQSWQNEKGSLQSKYQQADNWRQQLTERERELQQWQDKQKAWIKEQQRLQSYQKQLSEKEQQWHSEKTDWQKQLAENERELQQWQDKQKAWGEERQQLQSYQKQFDDARRQLAHLQKQQGEWSKDREEWRNLYSSYEEKQKALQRQLAEKERQWNDEKKGWTQKQQKQIAEYEGQIAEKDQQLESLRKGQQSWSDERQQLQSSFQEKLQSYQRQLTANEQQLSQWQKRQQQWDSEKQGWQSQHDKKLGEYQRQIADKTQKLALLQKQQLQWNSEKKRLQDNWAEKQQTYQRQLEQQKAKLEMLRTRQKQQQVEKQLQDGYADSNENSGKGASQEVLLTEDEKKARKKLESIFRWGQNAKYASQLRRYREQAKPFIEVLQSHSGRNQDFLAQYQDLEKRMLAAEEQELNKRVMITLKAFDYPYQKMAEITERFAQNPRELQAMKPHEVKGIAYRLQSYGKTAKIFLEKAEEKYPNHPLVVAAREKLAAIEKKSEDFLAVVEQADKAQAFDRQIEMLDRQLADARKNSEKTSSQQWQNLAVKYDDMIALLNKKGQLPLSQKVQEKRDECYQYYIQSLCQIAVKTVQRKNKDSLEKIFAQARQAANGEEQLEGIIEQCVDLCNRWQKAEDELGQYQQLLRQYLEKASASAATKGFSAYIDKQQRVSPQRDALLAYLAQNKGKVLQPSTHRYLQQSKDSLYLEHDGQVFLYRWDDEAWQKFQQMQEQQTQNFAQYRDKILAKYHVSEAGTTGHLSWKFPGLYDVTLIAVVEGSISYTSREQQNPQQIVVAKIIGIKSRYLTFWPEGTDTHQELGWRK